MLRRGGAARLFFWRFGARGRADGRIDIAYTTSGTAVRSVMTRDGQRFGSGLEIGLGGRARLRVDYTLTQYDRYEASYGTKADVLDHFEALFRLGLSWRP